METLQAIRRGLLVGEKFKVVFLGDSITSAEWVHPNWREVVEYVLKDMFEQENDWDWKLSSWGIRCINSGFNGASMADLLDRFEEAVGSHNPSLVIFAEGGVDLPDLMSVEEYIDKAKGFVRRIKQSSQNVIFCSPTPTLKSDLNEKIRPYVEAVKEILPLSGVEFVDLFSELLKFDLPRMFTFLSPFGNSVLGMKAGEVDWVHPNQFGNLCLAKVILAKGFGIEFDPERYLKESAEGKMYPGY